MTREEALDFVKKDLANPLSFEQRVYLEWKQEFPCSIPRKHERQKWFERMLKIEDSQYEQNLHLSLESQREVKQYVERIINKQRSVLKVPEIHLIKMGGISEGYAIPVLIDEKGDAWTLSNDLGVLSCKLSDIADGLLSQVSSNPKL